MTSIQPLAGDYPAARRAFLAAAQAAGAQIRHERHDARGPGGEGLYLDTAWLGDPDARRVAVVVSATHGVEGFAGSALQTDLAGLGPRARPAWWDRRPAGARPQPVRIRVDPSRERGQRRPEPQFRRLLGPPARERRLRRDRPPAGAASAGTRTPRQATLQALLAYAERVGMEGMQAAVSSGQYRHPNGIFYGGSGPSWSHRKLRALCETAALARRAGRRHRPPHRAGTARPRRASLLRAARQPRVRAHPGLVRRRSQGAGVRRVRVVGADGRVGRARCPGGCRTRR